MYAVLLGAFAGSAVVIAAVGLFGVLSFSVAQRTRELAIRAALGASRREIVRLVLRQGLSVTLGGIAAGMLASTWLTRVLSTQLYGVTPHDRLTFALVPLVLLAVGALACLLPARRAASSTRCGRYAEDSTARSRGDPRDPRPVETQESARSASLERDAIRVPLKAIGDLAGREALVDLGEGRLNLLLPHGMRRRRRLALELGPGQPQRFDCTGPFGVRRRLRVGAAAPFGFPLFHLLLDSRVCVDQAFSRVTHSQKF